MEKPNTLMTATINSCFVPFKHIGDNFYRPLEPSVAAPALTKADIDRKVADLRGEGATVIEIGVDQIPSAWEFDSPKLEYLATVNMVGENSRVRTFLIKDRQAIQILVAIAVEAPTPRTGAEIVNPEIAQKIGVVATELRAASAAIQKLFETDDESDWAETPALAGIYSAAMVRIGKICEPIAAEFGFDWETPKFWFTLGEAAYEAWRYGNHYAVQDLIAGRVGTTPRP